MSLSSMDSCFACCRYLKQHGFELPPAQSASSEVSSSSIRTITQNTSKSQPMEAKAVITHCDRYDRMKVGIHENCRPPAYTSSDALALEDACITYNLVEMKVEEEDDDDYDVSIEGTSPKIHDSKDAEDDGLTCKMSKTEINGNEILCDVDNVSQNVDVVGTYENPDSDGGINETVEKHPECGGSMETFEVTPDRDDNMEEKDEETPHSNGNMEGKVQGNLDGADNMEEETVGTTLDSNGNMDEKVQGNLDGAGRTPSSEGGKIEEDLDCDGIIEVKIEEDSDCDGRMESSSNCGEINIGLTIKFLKLTCLRI